MIILDKSVPWESHLQRKYVHIIELNLDIVGSASNRKKESVKYWASSAADEEEKQPGLRDKKYEGFSNLKGAHE